MNGGTGDNALHDAITRFNENHRVGVRLLITSGVLASTNISQSLALFLHKYMNALDPAQVGALLADSAQQDSYAQDLINAFFGCFSFDQLNALDVIRTVFSKVAFPLGAPELGSVLAVLAKHVFFVKSRARIHLEPLDPIFANANRMLGLFLELLRLNALIHSGNIDQEEEVGSDHHNVQYDRVEALQRLRRVLHVKYDQRVDIELEAMCESIRDQPIELVHFGRSISSTADGVGGVQEELFSSTPTYTGWLAKASGKGRRLLGKWDNRRFVLADKTLCYFDSDKPGAVLKGIIPLADCRCVVGERQFGFRISNVRPNEPVRVVKLNSRGTGGAASDSHGAASDTRVTNHTHHSLVLCAADDISFHEWARAFAIEMGEVRHIRDTAAAAADTTSAKQLGQVPPPSTSSTSSLFDANNFVVANIGRTVRGVVTPAHKGNPDYECWVLFAVGAPSKVKSLRRMYAAVFSNSSSVPNPHTYQDKQHHEGRQELNRQSDPIAHLNLSNFSTTMIGARLYVCHTNVDCRTMCASGDGDGNVQLFVEISLVAKVRVSTAKAVRELGWFGLEVVMLDAKVYTITTESADAYSNLFRILSNVVKRDNKLPKPPTM